MPTVEVAPKGPRPPIRVRPVPRCDPPFDDELDPQVWAGPGQLAFEWPTQTATRPPARRPTPEMAAALRELTTDGPDRSAAEHPPAGRGVVTTRRSADALTGEAQTPAPGPAGASGDAKLAVRRFVHLCVEVLNGYRPAAHLRRLSLPKEAAGVVAQAVAGAGRVAELRREARAGRRHDRTPGLRNPMPGLRSPVPGLRDPRPGRKPSPVAVIRLRLCEPRPGAVEAAVLLVTGERTWAMALRLELHQQSWHATALRLI